MTVAAMMQGGWVLIGFGTVDPVDDPGYRLLRIGDYRVVYTLDNGQIIIWVVIVGRRDEGYKDLHDHLGRADG